MSGRVVTAPTNGAAGVIPAVLRYYRDHCAQASPEGLQDIHADGGGDRGAVQDERLDLRRRGRLPGRGRRRLVDGGGGAVRGARRHNAQIENAAEIAMEHHLGMTCDPVGGLVQIPCIERNAFGAIKAIAAASLALHGDGSHKVSLDSVIATMRQTGADMQSKYKETSLGRAGGEFRRVLRCSPTRDVGNPLDTGGGNVADATAGSKTSEYHPGCLPRLAWDPF